MENSAQVTDAIQLTMAEEVQDVKASLARLSQKMTDIQQALMAASSQPPLPTAEYKNLEKLSNILKAHSLRAEQIDDRMYVTNYYGWLRLLTF
jgi:type II secretory pathway component PulM